MKKPGSIQLLLLCLAAWAAPSAHAANAAQLTANGATSAGMGGTSIALPQDATAAADNPAGMANVGTRMDIYGVLLRVESHSTFGSVNNSHESKVLVPAPGLGFNYQLSPQWTFGVAITGAGLSANYKRPVLPISGAGDAKSNLVIVNTSPTVTYKPREDLALGASVILGLQQFRASGVIGAGPDGGPVALPGHGNSWAKGLGAGVGALWEAHPMVSLGASYYTKTRFSSLSGYRDDLLAPSGGKLVNPSRYGLGVAVKPAPGVILALDYVKIRWADAEGFNTPQSFSWHNQNVLRFGAQFQLNDRLTVRGGYNHASSHLDSEHTLANFYANGINNRSVSVGMTYSVDRNSSLVGAFEYCIPRTLNGTGVSTGTNISTNFQVLSIGYSYKF
ncbi:OmpP1/FadL family transporter [Azohydromonas lata]|uniref:Hydrocarbon degradation protein n=1 Tax=Azohydromonas lata TaxID=45677 RepID=A0ABU5IML0_9BURK|nr:hydrocarbon degradation protein [Azohydromonas lata]MDZ5460094.1 hydrocarbon degradation protein [Azohydromonas lata]